RLKERAAAARFSLVFERRHSGMVRKHQTADAQLRIGESRDSGFDASHRPGMTVCDPYQTALPFMVGWPAEFAVHSSMPPSVLLALMENSLPSNNGCSPR